jgi:hypothetical protein
VRIAVFNLTRVPAPVRWATASVTAAAAIVLAMLSYNSEQPSKGVQISEVKQPTHSVTAPQHTPAEVKVSQPAPQPKVVVAKPRTVAVREVRPARHRSPVRTHTEVARELNKKPGHEEFRASEIPNAEVGVNVAAEPIPTEVPENTDAALIPNPTAPAEPQEIKLSPTAEAQPEWQKKEAEALADLRTKLAARNKQRRVQVHTEPIEGKKVTVELASIRF